MDADEKKILSLYKQKEGNELRTIRHWGKYAILIAIFTCFLATSIYNLTVKILKNSPVKKSPFR